MFELMLLIGLIVLVVVLIGGSKRKRELTEVQTKIAKEEYKRIESHGQSDKERYDALGKIKEFLDQGVLSTEEFEAEKKRILSGADSPPPEPDTQSNRVGNLSSEEKRGW